MDKQTRLDIHWLKVAFINSSLSKDPSTKVGALILDKNGTSTGMGYNGFPVGTPETEEMWMIRENKYPRVIHAEANAIFNTKFDMSGGTIYCTLHPCYQCLGFIIQAKISRIVYYGEPWTRDTNYELLQERLNLLEVVQYKDIKEIELLKEYLGNTAYYPFGKA